MSLVGLKLSKALCIRSIPTAPAIIIKDIVPNDRPIVQIIRHWKLWPVKLRIVFREILNIERTKHSNIYWPGLSVAPGKEKKPKQGIDPEHLIGRPRNHQPALRLLYLPCSIQPA